MQRFSKIDWLDLQSYQKELTQDDNFVLAKNALVNNSILELTLDYYKYTKLNDHFDFDNKNTNQATDQKQSGRCWLFATLNMVRDKFVNEYKLETFEFSQAYLAFWDKLEKANAFLNYIIETVTYPWDDRYLYFLLNNFVSDGGFFEIAKALIQKYGVVPKQEMVDSKIAQNTSIINMLLQTKLKQAALAIRCNANDQTKMVALKEEFLFAIYQILVYAYGKLPQKFDVVLKPKKPKNAKKIHWKDLTPKVFLQRIKFNVNSFSTLTFSHTNNLKPFQKYEHEFSAYVFENGNLSFISVNQTAFLLAALAMISQNQSLYFACDVSHQMDLKKGVWDASLYDFSAFLGVTFCQDMSQNIQNCQVRTNHAMTLQGFSWNQKEWEIIKKNFLSNNTNLNLKAFQELVQLLPITKWKVENSWGEKVGNRGFFVMNHSWFKNYVSDIVVHQKYLSRFLQKPFFLTKKEFSMFDFAAEESRGGFLYKYFFEQAKNSEPIILKPWTIY